MRIRTEKDGVKEKQRKDKHEKTKQRRVSLTNKQMRPSKSGTKFVQKHLDRSDTERVQICFGPKLKYSIKFVQGPHKKYSFSEILQLKMS